MTHAKHKTETIQVSELSWGDTIIADGVLTTVGKNCVKYNGFFGTTVFGQRINIVERVLFPKWFKGEVIGYFSQI